MTQREDFEAWWGEFSSAHEDWKYADSAALRWAAWQAAQAAQPARQVPTTNYEQPVPDHCDRITWRNRYYHLPLAAELSAARAQEPLTDATKASCALGYEECSHRCGTPHVCCDHYVEPEPIATPIPPVRDPLSYRDILRIYNEVGPEDGVPYRFAGAIEAITKEQA